MLPSRGRARGAIAHPQSPVQFSLFFEIKGKEITLIPPFPCQFVSICQKKDRLK